MEQFEQHLADESLRHEFYARLKAFSRCLHISLSSDKLFDVFDEAKVDALKRDWKQFSELKRSVQLRYQETVDVREFEPKIQKLLNGPGGGYARRHSGQAAEARGMVTRQQRHFAKFLPRTPERRFVAGETHLYLGRQYRLKVVPHVQELSLIHI